jgi:predicted PurR-regulated permease PerM
MPADATTTSAESAGTDPVGRQLTSAGDAPSGSTHLPSDRTTFAWWTRTAIILWAVVGAGIIALGVRQVVGTIVPSLAAFFLAGLLLAIFRPITGWLKSRGVGDAIAALAGVASALVVMGLVSALFLVPVVSGAVGVMAAAPAASASVNAKLQAGIANYQGLPAQSKAALANATNGLMSAVSRASTGFARFVVSSTAGLFALGLDTFLALILMFWFLKDGPRMASSTLAVIPQRIRQDVSMIASSFDRSFSGYLLATAINCSIIFVLDGIGFAIIRLPNGWFIAAMGSLLGVIPYVGSILGFFVAVAIGLLAGPTTGALTGAIIVTTDQIVYSFIGPVVAAKTVSLHPVMIMFAVLVGASLAGVLGAILSIPVAAAIAVIYRYYRDRDAQNPDSGPGAAAREEA